MSADRVSRIIDGWRELGWNPRPADVDETIAAIVADRGVCWVIDELEDMGPRDPYRYHVKVRVFDAAGPYEGGRQMLWRVPSVTADRAYLLNTVREPIWNSREACGHGDEVVAGVCTVCGEDVESCTAVPIWREERDR